MAPGKFRQVAATQAKDQLLPQRLAQCAGQVGYDKAASAVNLHQLEIDPVAPRPQVPGDVGQAQVAVQSP